LKTSHSGDWPKYATTRDRGIRYVGCSNNPQRRLSEHRSHAPRQKCLKSEWIRELIALDLSPTLVILETVVGSWEEAEQRWIAACRDAGARLTNLTDGGAGSIGLEMSEENRLALADRMRGNHLGRDLTPEQRRKMSDASKAAWKNPQRKKAPPRSAETREKLSKAASGKKHDPVAKLKMSLSHQDPSAETREKYRQAIERRPADVQTRFTYANKGRQFTDEHRANMSAAAKERWRKRREATPQQDIT